ncbi:MAG: phenylalanine--tRNA ligase subunit beta [Ectothiorhodospiraceae bacterium]|jgi:phenylalanyl-tRNA synthetase beta chain|nr:phenylalanine--tRNA ligase subunit beta [Ectothiorhodospiraceae bacterium]
MKISNRWLLEWVDHGLSAEDLGHRLTMAGLELDAIEPAAPAFEGVAVARVVSVAPHPDADKLRVCQVDDGGAVPVQVVCGAANVREGMHVPFARVGARLPGGLDIRKAKLRGIESFGMLCSAKELGLADSADGLMPLPDDAVPGIDLRAYLELDDSVLEVDLTPNRADCLSIAGIARETSVLTGAVLAAPAIESVPATIDDTLPVHIDAAADCPRYAGRVVRGLRPDAETPLWMRERLRRSGIRSLGPLVDVTNYVMLELGQPMHAFDLARIAGGIVVRKATAGETLTLLDGQVIELDPDALVIADTARPLALAGIMGGESSGVDATTVDVFLEAAHFDPRTLAGRARRYGLHTESSHRFERGVDPALPGTALERATRLLLDIAGGQTGPVTDILHAAQLRKIEPIRLRSARVERLIGVALAADETEAILVRLGCAVERTDEGWHVTPPTHRFDLAIEVDLIEEIARVYGYHRIPSVNYGYTPTARVKDEARIDVQRLREHVVALGYQEAITFSFVDPAHEKLLSPDRAALALANPISSELAVMRTTLWAGLLKAVQHNLNRQQRRIRIFEIGLSFIPQDNELIQKNKIAGVLCGTALPEQWAAPERAVDFFDLKGDVESLLAVGGSPEAFDFEIRVHPALHPGQSAAVTRDGQLSGWLGALNPDIEKQLGLDRPVYLFELDLEAITLGRVPRYVEQSRFPSIRRDIALLVDAEVSAARIGAAIEAVGLSELREFHVFDVYTGTGVPAGRKSVALGLILQDLSRTLTDGEVDDLVARIVAGLEKDVGAALRT